MFNNHNFQSKRLTFMRQSFGSGELSIFLINISKAQSSSFPFSPIRAIRRHRGAASSALLQNRQEPAVSLVSIHISAPLLNLMTRLHRHQKGRFDAIFWTFFPAGCKFYRGRYSTLATRKEILFSIFEG